jgi:gamma-glutamyltranspeptidase / glutathione hydrolase
MKQEDRKQRMMTARPTTYAQHGMISTPHYLASQVGLRVLQEGGNAVDAAIAANATLNVVLPHQCHIGGDLFALVWDPSDESLDGLNASGPAPSGASVDQIRSLGHTSMPERGALPVTVPGTVAGWSALAKRYGSRGLDQLLAPAAGYARDGFPISAKLSASINFLGPLLDQFESASKVFRANGVPATADILRQPALAGTFDRVRAEGPAGFYEGAVAADIARTLQSGGSAMTEEDLATFEPEWVKPLSVNYRGVELVEFPPNTQGPMALLLANIAEGWPVTEIGHTSAAGVYAYSEAVRRALVERNAYIADPRTSDVPLERFTDKDVATAHREAIDRRRPSNLRPEHEAGDTVYLCVVDGNGLAISLIQSLYMGFGSGVLAPESGVLLQNRGFSFSLDPEHPNAIAGGKRPRHTLIPGMLLKDGKPWTVFGCMGGDAQAHIHMQLLMGLVDFGLDPQSAIETPRWVATSDMQGEPALIIESRFEPKVLQELHDIGHQLDVGAEWDARTGHSQMIQIDRERGVLAGGADPRGDGAAVGW